MGACHWCWRATQADVRGCEVFINEAIMDVIQTLCQFTNIPPLLLYNSFGVNPTETPSFSRRGFPTPPCSAMPRPVIQSTYLGGRYCLNK